MRKLSSLTLPWPTDWSELFGASRPLIVEIGFGNGRFLIHLAQQNPDANVIGLEISNRSLVNGEKAIARHKLTNTRVIHSAANTALHYLFREASIQQIHVNFPDPWFKKRHGRRRLVNHLTLNVIINRLEPGGMLYLATDILAYAEMSAELLSETPGLTNTLDTPWAPSLPGRITTKYEKKAAREGRDCYYFAYRRNDSAARRIRTIEELDMPHIVLKSPLNRVEILAQFSRSSHDFDDIHVALIGAYNGHHALLFEVYVNEPTIEQRVAVVLTERDDGDYTLKLGFIGNPRPTPGLHKAVAALGNWITNLHPDATILKRKLRE